MFPQEGPRRNPHPFSVFLATHAKVKPRRRSLGFAVDLAVRVPDYEIDGRLWRAQHYAGSYLFRDTVTIEAVPATDAEGRPTYGVRYGFDSKTPNRATRRAALERTDDGFSCAIPLSSASDPGLAGKLVLLAPPWK